MSSGLRSPARLAAPTERPSRPLKAEPPPGAVFEGPVLWIAGASSTYVLESDRPRMTELFPLVRLIRVKHAGHWVHSEQPEVFLEVLRRFIRAEARTALPG